ncbi:MAG: hypothetical protein JNL78_11950 [Rhodocyclaceae bacterium]|jgi:hypothetical protein|nr:hypothetical protein [Rhodocyclaceae bacterium]
MLSNTRKVRPQCPALLLAASILAAGCSTSPTSGRAQFNILPAPLESRVSDLRFSVKTELGTGDYCRDTEGPCAIREEAEKLAGRLSPIAERLGAVAPQLSPELVTRVPRVEVFVLPSESASVRSSGGGKIAVDAGLGKLGLSDTDLALALAREFGRLASAHHRESTSAGLAVSLVAGSPLVGTYLATSILADILFPMGSLVKLGISLLGSVGTEQLVEASQQEEADDFAGKLMLAAGYDLRELAAARSSAPESGLKIGWLPGYFTSRARVAGMAPPAESATGAVASQEPVSDGKAEAAAAPAGPVASAPANLTAPDPAQPPHGDARQEPPQEVKAETVATTPEASAETPVAPSGIKVEIAPPPEAGSEAAAAPAPPEAKNEVASSMPLTPAAIVQPEPAPTAKAETTEASVAEEDPPKAVPAVKKNAKKAVVKKAKKPRKPTKKIVRR